MNGTRCTLCKRNVDRASMSRCRDNRCPMRVSGQRGSASVWIGGGIGALFLGAIVMGSWLFAAPARSAGGDAQETASQARATATRQVISHAGTNVVKWLDSLVSAPGARPVDDKPAEVRDSALPDPRAGTRVITFSCSGAMSASRSRICTDWTLATVDYNLSLFYRSVLGRTRNPDALRRANAAWLARLDGVGSDTDDLLKFYSDWREDIARH